MRYIKFIRVFLLVLIIIGLGLLATQKIWIPKVVEMILKSENHESLIVPTLTSNTNYDLPDPGNLNLTSEQITSYASCDTKLGSTTLLFSKDCTVGQRIGDNLIVKSINSNNTVSFYLFTYTPRTFAGEEFSSNIVTYTTNQIIPNDLCGRKEILKEINYSQHYFTIEISGGFICASSFSPKLHGTGM